MSAWQNFKYRLMNFLGIKPKLSNIVLDNLRKQQEYNKDFVPTPTPLARKCGYHACKKRLKGLTYKCPYCNKTYCEAHRLPEEHNCPNPQLPQEMKRGYGTKQKSAISGRFASMERN